MKCTEILKLKEMLEKANIPFEFEEMNGGFHLIYPDNENRTCSVVEHLHSYGRDDDLLEIMGLLTNEEAEGDSVLGYLTADDVFKRISDDWKAEKE